jgi:hypothetical protein
MPIAAAIPALITAGGSIGGALLSRGGSGGGGSTPSFLQPFIKSSLDSVTSGTSPADAAISGGVNKLNTGSDTLGKSLGTLEPSKNFFTTALSGNKDALQQLLAPQISTTLAQYDNAQKSVAAFTPRGGGKTQELSSLPFQKVGAYEKALSGARTSAATELPKIAATEGAIGGEQATAGAEQAQIGEAQKNQITNLVGALLGQQFNRQQSTSSAWSSLGGGLGQLLINMIKGKSGGSSGGGQQIGTLDQIPATSPGTPGL